MDENCREGISKILVGNKVDLSHLRQVTFEEGKELADANGMLFFETSAKTGASVENVFLSAAEEIIKKNPGIVVAGSGKTVNLSNQNKEKSSGGCC